MFTSSDYPFGIIVLHLY